MKYGKHDIEWQTNIQGMSLSDFCDYLRKREGIFNQWYLYQTLYHPAYSCITARSNYGNQY